MVETFGMGAPAGKRISLKSVGANILCRNHNSQLNPLDDAIGELADALSEFWRCGGTQLISVDGTLIERWMLKYIFGASSAGYIDGKKMYPDERAVRQLFGLDPIMDRFALYGVALPSVHRIYNTSVSMRALAQFGREVDLCLFAINALPLIAYTGDGDPQEALRSMKVIDEIDVRQAIVKKRPKLMQFDQPEGRLTINFSYS